MMERNYQLVAWTENITDKEDARLYMIPSLECEVQADLVTDLTFIHREEYKLDGPVSLDLARRAVLAYERMTAIGSTTTLTSAVTHTSAENSVTSSSGSVKKACALRRNSGVKMSFRRGSQSGYLRCITSRLRRNGTLKDI